MSNTIRIKRRASGDVGAPASLLNAELAFNEVGDVLYYGKGTGGAGGSATAVEPIGGKGAFVDKSSAQSIAGVKTFDASPIVPTADSSDSSTKAASTAFVKAQNYITSAQAPVQSVAGKTGTVTLAVADISGAAPIASPTFTGIPAAPTATAGTSSTQIATTAFVAAAIAALIDAAPGALDTLNELAAAIADDPNFASTITNGLAEKLAKASNLSDLTNVATARTNLGLGTMATQAASNVAITGGSIDGISFDGGTF